MGAFEYVYVRKDGSARELSVLEKIYLRTRFRGADGGRPYIKARYECKDGWGSLSGFCPRAALPATLRVDPIVDRSTRAEIEKELRNVAKMGYTVDTTGIEGLE